MFNVNFPANYDIGQRWQFVYDQFKVALTPVLGSPLIDSGVVVPGVHCSTAGEVGNCRTWYGLAPDIGAYEYNPGIQTCMTQGQLNIELKKFVDMQIGIVPVTNKVVSYLGC